MPRATKSHAATSKPYSKISKEKAEELAKAVTNVILQVFMDDVEPTLQASSDDETEQEEEPQDLMPPVSLDSDDSALQTALAPHQAVILKSEKMLDDLRPFLQKFVSTKNSKGTEEAAGMIVKYQAAIATAQGEIASLTEAWQLHQQNRRQAEENAKRQTANKKSESSKSKGKSKAPRNDGKPNLDSPITTP
jgi:hypothetical protein